MQVLVGEWKESIVVVPHRFIDEFSPEAEIVEELITKDVVVPSDDFLVIPAAFLHHQCHIGREDDRDGRMLFDESDDS